MVFFKKIIYTGVVLLLGLGSKSFAQFGEEFQISEIPDRTIHVGDNYSYPVYSTSYETVKNVSIIRGANWLKVGDYSERVYGTPSSTGTYDFTISATYTDENNFTLYDTESFTITVEENPAPRFSSSPVKTGKENELYRYDISVDDDNRYRVDLSVVSKPSFLSFTDNGSGDGRLEGTPGYDDSGTYTVEIKASDNNSVDPKSTIKTYTLTVENTNREPSITSQAPTSGEEGTKYTYAVEAGDPDGESLSYSKTSGPKWLSFSDSTLQGTPGYSDAGRYIVKIKVSDGNDGTDTESFELTVLDINQSPKIESIGKQSVKENEEFSYRVSASDPDGNNLSFSKTAGPKWLSFSGRILQGTPGYFDAGSYTVKIKVLDGNGGSDSELFELNVSNTNRSPGIEPIGKQSVKENKPFSYSVSASDPDGDDISYSKISGPQWLSISRNELQGKPGYSDAGSYTVKVRASDGNGGTDTESFTLSVFNVNRSPSIASEATLSGKEGTKYIYEVDASDPDGDDLSYSKIDGPKWLSFSGRTLQGTPGYSDAGSYTVEIQVSDGNGGRESVSFELSISNINQAPEIASTPPAKAIEGSTYTYVIKATDGDGDPITYSYEEGPSWLSLSENTLSGTPGYSLSGKVAITVNVSDGEDSNTQSYTLTVGDSDREPTFTSKPVTNVEEQETYSYPITVFDADGEDVSISVVQKGEWMSFSDHGDGTAMLSGTPNADQSGSYEVILQANDESNQVEQAFTVRVEDVGRAPQITSKPPTFVKEEVAYIYHIKASDPDGDNITFEYADGPEWFSISKADPTAGTATLSGTPPASTSGEYKIRIVASAGVESTTQQYTLEVGTGNGPPTITSQPIKGVTAEKSYRYELRTTDQEDDKINFSMETGPGFLALTEQIPEAGTAVLGGTAGPGDLGEHEIIIKVTDDGDPQKSTQQQFTLTVYNKNNAAPKITSTPVKSIFSGLRYRYLITASDKEDDLNDVITITATGPEGKALPEFLSLKDIFTEDSDVAQKELAGTPGDGDIGQYELVVTATDGQGAKDTQRFTLTITQGNRPPTFSSLPPTAAQVGVQYTYQINVSDPDEDSLHYSATLSGEDRLPGWLSFSQEDVPTLAGMPAESDVGVYQILITARDNSKPANEETQEFTLEVTLEEITELRVFYNYPNPFQVQTKIKFALPIEAPVSMELYNTAGSLVRKTEPKNYRAGVNEIRVEAHNMQSGIYIYRLITSEEVETGRFTLIR